MPSKSTAVRAELRLKAKHLLSAAGAAIEKSLAMVGDFKDAAAFKAEMIRHLNSHTEFDRAARGLHAHHHANRQEFMSAPGAKSKPQVTPKIAPSGRVQATRFDPKGQRDRRAARA